ncbi:MAG: DEAD/DEAH box helicase, partial [Anaerolineae bacterium]|nr:DEAD/DEAH box helicase [Anaerolineae bacterium]
EITAIINTNISSADLAFQWSMIKNNLFACHFYFSAYEMLIRPLLPPTSTHTPFTIAKQRIYMSATLGEGGDLERITGRKNIHRLQIPTGWDKQGIGRRFFLLPERSLSDEEQDELLLKVITQTGRALILCPNDKSSITISKNINEKLGVPIFNARVIESSKIPFISEEMAVAVMANRYDGIDFPDDECRLLIIDGLPRATNLQERFIINNMGAVELLNDRILTRIVQAFGRCTRSATDYSVVIIRGEELTKYIMTRERRRFLHPEIQAEIDFGIEQSKSTSIDEFLENISIFIKQSSDWAEADSEILILRDKSEQLLLPGTDNLRNSANLENDYQNALWSGDIVTAFEISRSIISLLTAPELKGYRALWYYLAGSAAWLADFQKMGNFDSKSKELFRLALSATGTIRWLVELSRNNLVETPNSEMVDETQTLLLVERVEGILDKLGTIQNHKFDRFVSEIIAGLNSENFKEFEETHVKIGKLLGYEAGNKETNGAPDPWWIVDENFCFIFEDHSDAVSDTLHIDKARQINTHPNWVKENLDVSEHVKILPVLITPTKKADVDALPHLRDVFLWPLDDFRAWALNAISTIRELRSTFTGIGDLAWRADAVAAFNKNMLSPRTLSDYLQKHIAADELKEK